MRFKVFLVEDEIVTREGIRDNVNWEASGFEFCGEAMDGEIALQLIEESKPDVIITDIKMPFMDGIQLSKIVREKMPWVKIIILSGHDEFNFAQSAVKLGVTEYLLKPISARDLEKVLARTAKLLDKEKQESRALKQLQTRLEDSLVLSREKFLLDMLMGVLNPAETVEKSQQLGLNILGKYYLVAVIEIDLCTETQTFDYHQYRRIEQIVSEFAGTNLDVLLTKKDFEELILFIKGDEQEQLINESKFLANLIKTEIENQIDCNLNIRFGSVQERLANVHISFLEALIKDKTINSDTPREIKRKQPFHLVTINHYEIEKYLKFGSIKEFDNFFEKTLKPFSELSLQSHLLKEYLFIDLLLNAVRISEELSTPTPQLSAKLVSLEETISNINSIDEIKEEIKKIIFEVIDIRSSQIENVHTQLILKVKAYLDNHFSNSDLSLNSVSEEFNLSASYFSTIFRKETGITFKDYLTNRRIEFAKELLRTTNLTIADIALQSGYNDPHYFSHIFKKKTDITPSQFREES